MRSICFATGVVLGAIWLGSCGHGTAATSTGRPTVLRYCFTSSNEDLDTAIQRTEKVRQYLERILKVRVEATRATGYASVIEAFRANKIDAASISPFSYVLASEKTPIEAIVMRSSANGDPGEYTGVLAVPGNSPIRSIGDVVRHSKELTISFVDPASTSGFLVEHAYLQSRGLDPQRDFRKVVFSMNHIASLMTLKAGKVDVAACMKRLVDGYLKAGKLAPGDVRVIWVSPPLPNQPTAVRKDLPAPFKEELRRALLEMHWRDPEAFAARTPKAFSAFAEAHLPYAPANDAMFDGLRQMVRSVKNLSLLER